MPDGSLFRLTPGQLRSVRGLAKRCCNFLDGDCLLLDGVCPQYISRSLLCRWFRRAVLPQQPKLEQAILSPKKPRLRQGGSPPAEGEIRSQTAHGRIQFGGEKSLNYKPSRTAKVARQYDFPRSRESNSICLHKHHEGRLFHEQHSRCPHPPQNDTDHQGGGRVQQHRHQQDRQYAPQPQLPIRLVCRDEKTGQAPGV